MKLSDHEQDKPMTHKKHLSMKHLSTLVQKPGLNSKGPSYVMKDMLQRKDTDETNISSSYVLAMTLSWEMLMTFFILMEILPSNSNFDIGN